MEFTHLRSASPVKIIIVPKAEEKPDLNSSILSNFAASHDKGAADKPSLGAPPAQAKPYSPYITGVIKSLQEQAVEKKDANIPTHIEEMVYVKEHVDADIELTVFKHKEVNSLIRNRILALENSVVSKTVEKKPLIEVDKTIKEVVQEQEDEPILEQLKSHKEKEVMLPTSKIRELAMSSQRKEPVYEIPIPKKPESQSESESESESEDESEDESESSTESESVNEPLVVTQAILKEPEPPKPLRPIVTKQYSFDMDKKFHEEKDDGGWKKVEEIKLASTSSSESDDHQEPVVQTPGPSTSVPPNDKFKRYVQSDSDSSMSMSTHEQKKYRDGRYRKPRDYPPGASPEEKRRLDDETIQRILTYERSMERDGDNGETFEEYLRRRNEKIGYDTDLNTSISEYESDTYTEGSDYTEYTNAVENESFINYQNWAREGDYDSQSEYTEYTDYTEDSVFPRQYGSESEYYTDDVGRDGYYDDRSDRSEYYTDEGDDVTIVDEEEYARERAHGRAPGYDQQQFGEVSPSQEPGYDQWQFGEVSLGKEPGYDQRHFDATYTDEYTDVYSDYNER